MADRRFPRTLARCALRACLLLPLTADDRYLEDFAFLRDTIARNGAAVKVRGLDWAKECAKFESRFAKCASDIEHVQNVRELLAVLDDGHTSVTRSSVDLSSLPSKFDGLFGAGLWFAVEDGLVLLRDALRPVPGGAEDLLGNALVEIDGEPAGWVLERELRRIRRFQGTSSEHSLFATLGNRLLPFGERKSLTLTFLDADGREREVVVGPWGPGGKAFSPARDTLPAGIEYADGATGGLLGGAGKVGYLRITGAQNAETVAAFHRAFDALREMESLLLDCRGMGGGGDAAAWEMCGRLFSSGVANGRGRIEPTGSWQFEGPVLMLQDELEVSSAETFTWALSETGRVLSLGRPTGGWALIPKGFSCPSGLVDFRLGVTDRGTPIGDLHTEGSGWPPDLCLPYGPRVFAAGDPTLDLARLALAVHASERGDARSSRERLRALFEGRAADFAKSVQGREGVDAGEVRRLGTLLEEDLAERLKLELALLEDDRDPRLGLLRSRARHERFAKLPFSTAAKKTWQAWGKRLDALRKEERAEEEYLAMADDRLQLSAEDRDRFTKKHGKTRFAAAVRKEDRP